MPDVILEITELANRFRETPQTIKDALRLLRDIGRAEPADLDGCWKLQLAGTLPLPPFPRPPATHKRPKGSYVRPQLSWISLAEARMKLQAEVIPGDAVGQEMLRRIQQLAGK